MVDSISVIPAKAGVTGIHNFRLGAVLEANSFFEKPLFFLLSVFSVAKECYFFYNLSYHENHSD